MVNALVIDEVLVNLIGDDPEAVLRCPLADGFRFVQIHHGTGGVGR
ncbi:unannotated protein [freshwater metagenome]|uniref:Unannotated protein n=1 Tax=freshwater metagenome TaxID=449393 RepID=A0A6J6KLI2_9ZZZZ